MESFNQVFFYLVENNNITLNSNILETGLINILGLIAILIYVGQDFLISNWACLRTFSNSCSYCTINSFDFANISDAVVKVFKIYS
jgi:hypothetical protein